MRFLRSLTTPRVSDCNRTLRLMIWDPRNTIFYCIIFHHLVSHMKDHFHTFQRTETSLPAATNALIYNVAVTALVYPPWPFCCVCCHHHPFFLKSPSPGIPINTVSLRGPSILPSFLPPQGAHLWLSLLIYSHNSCTTHTLMKFQTLNPTLIHHITTRNIFPSFLQKKKMYTKSFCHTSNSTYHSKSWKCIKLLSHLLTPGTPTYKC